MKHKFYALFILQFFATLLFAENTTITKHQIRWTGIDSWQSEKSGKKVLSFIDAQYPSDNDLPYFVENRACDRSFNYSVNIINPVFEALTTEEESLMEGKSIPEQIEIQATEIRQHGQSLLNIQLLPLALIDGTIKKLVSFDLQVEKTSKPFKVPEALHTYTSSSVLATGKFVKIKIQDSGIYKLTYETLKSMGIDPANVRVFGYGGALLEQDFLSTKPDDLPELSVWMEKGADGVFGAGDYILFYGQGIIKWKFDATKSMFTHTLNNYSNYGYYFVSSDAGVGKKITDHPITVPENATIVNVNEFTDYQVHELEKQNLAQSGKVFYGETFSDVLSYNFPFSFPNVVNSATTKVRIDVAANSDENSSFVLKLNDLQQQTIHMLKVNTSSEVAKDANAVFTFTPSADNLIFNLAYTKTNSNSKAYLNYLEVNVRRKLSMSGSVLLFRNTDNLNKTTYSRYQLSGAGANVQIWNVTDPLTITKLVTTKTTDGLEFVDSNTTLQEYLAIDPTVASAFTSPTVEGDVPNQNLHGLSAAELVIITNPAFVSQAEKLAQAHREKDKMKVAVVTTEQVYNEFSSGTPDATAYRWVMKMLYDRALEQKDTTLLPNYLLLFGRGSFDNRGIIPNSGNNLILTYQSDISLDKINSVVTDDYFGFLDDNEGLQITSNYLDLGIGRFPVVTSEQADNMVNKTITYMNNNERGDWKNQLCFVADDGGKGDGTIHMRQSDAIADSVFAYNPAFQLNKIYLDSYLQEVTASGENYPLATTRLHNLLRSGIFMLNYTGHASQLGWTNENLITTADIKEMYNTKLPIWIGATCDFILFDVKDISAGEYVVLNPVGGGISLFSAARTVYSSQNEALNKCFTRNLFTRTNGKYNRLGDAVVYSKNLVGAQTNKLSYILLGDPAVRLNYPTDYTIVTTKINNKLIQSVDTLKALSVDSVEGFIADEKGNIVNEFNGTLDVNIYDKNQRITTLDNHGEGTMTYNDRPNVLYSGKASVKNGNFNFSFMIPKDIKYNYGTGRINYYASDTVMNKEAQGYFENFLVGGSSLNYEKETNGPNLNIYLNSDKFVSGGKVNETPMFFAGISDINGINTVGSGIGHDLRLVIDDDPTTSYTLNDYFEAETNNYKAGSVRYKIPTLTQGKHSLTFHSWDLLNNSSQAKLDFEVVTGLSPTIFNVYNYPNPIRSQTRFVVVHDRPETILETTVDLFDLTGRKIWTTKQNSVENLKWNLQDTSLNQVKPGIYLYKISIKTTNSEMTSKANKIIVLGQ